MALPEPERTRIRAEFGRLVNMTAPELRDWLEGAASLSVGWKGADGTLHESIGHASGRWIADILDRLPTELSHDDFVQMRRTVGYIRRHLAQQPTNMVTSRWRYSLMNWGHDPLKA